jgi:putative alpha-1,2-mannosidase
MSQSLPAKSSVIVGIWCGVGTVNHTLQQVKSLEWSFHDFPACRVAMSFGDLSEHPSPCLSSIQSKLWQV